TCSRVASGKCPTMSERSLELCDANEVGLMCSSQRIKFPYCFGVFTIDVYLRGPGRIISLPCYHAHPARSVRLGVGWGERRHRAGAFLLTKSCEAWKG